MTYLGRFGTQFGARNLEFLEEFLGVALTGRRRSTAGRYRRASTWRRSAAAPYFPIGAPGCQRRRP
jgi:hypothetical protein